ncbi:MAG: hypothetical protein EXQ96_00120 [Alphaproteobacteria bacterium]|nr:hypothetical protein [Alphaproteobacteria bacterium]
MRHLLRLLLCGALALLPLAARAVEVSVVNASKPTRCAEEDNVYVKLQSDGVRRFTVTARHPPYLGAVTVDSAAADFTHCAISGAKDYPFTPRSVTLFEDGEWRLMGHTYGGFWTPYVVPVRVGARVESGLHLLQLIRRHKGEWIELLVLYPADGYWRTKPLPPDHLPDTAYGSSFLFGPIVERERPLVVIDAVEYVPATRTFRLAFAEGGGTGTLRLAGFDTSEVTLAVALERTIAPDRPFAALRSMFVTPGNADVIEAAFIAGDGRRGIPAGILDFARERAAEVSFGRRWPSRHNLSAPDLIFGAFGR